MFGMFPILRDDRDLWMRIIKEIRDEYYVVDLFRFFAAENIEVAFRLMQRRKMAV